MDRRTPNRSVADRKYRNRGFPGAFRCYCNRGCCSLDLREKKAGEKDIDRVKYRIICKDGTVKKVLDYGRSVHTEMYGEVYYVVMNDITEEDS